MPDKLAMMVVVGHETTPVASETQNKPVEDVGDTTAGQLIESSEKVRAKKKTCLEKGGSSKPTDLLSVIKEVDEIMNTPVNKETPLDEVEELRINMLKHSDFLRKREEHVESLAKTIEKEQEMSAKTSRQLFEEKSPSKTAVIRSRQFVAQQQFKILGSTGAQHHSVWTEGGMLFSAPPSLTLLLR